MIGSLSENVRPGSMVPQSCDNAPTSPGYQSIVQWITGIDS